MNNSKRVDSKLNKFLKLNPENDTMNQYWFSENTIQFFVNQIEKYSSSTEKIGMISTPSVFFSCNGDIQSKAFLFDYDDKLLKKHKNCIKYDFNNEQDFESLYPPENFKNCFDFLIIDPPYITEDAWTKFSNFAQYLAKADCKIITCSIRENEKTLKNLLNLDIKNYQPSIPHLVYQYNIYSNYNDEELDMINCEIPQQ